MTAKQNSSLGIVFILGLLAMLMPLSIDMYLPALPVISAQFGVPAGSAQMTLSTYILGFAVGQLLYGPMADSLGRKPVILGGTLIFATAAAAKISVPPRITGLRPMLSAIGPYSSWPKAKPRI